MLIAQSEALSLRQTQSINKKTRCDCYYQSAGLGIGCEQTGSVGVRLETLVMRKSGKRLARREDHFTIVPVRPHRVLLKKSEMALRGKAALLGVALSS